MSTSINLKLMYNKAYTRSVFDAKKAFDSVWDVGVLQKAMNDGLPAILSASSDPGVPIELHRSELDRHLVKQYA